MNKKKIINVHNTAYVKKITPIDLCGKTVMWQLSLDGVYTIPFEIEPTPGKHDYNGCSPCKNSIVELTKVLTQRFEGGSNQKGFPFCCIGHSNLPKIKEFKREDFEKVPNVVARKVIYTIQHFINVAETPDWYKRTIDYLEWVILSFGQMPKDCGEPLYLSSYFFHVEDMMRRNKHVPENRKDKIVKMIGALRANESKPETDINILASIYERWIVTFPFELNSYFGDMKEGFTKNLLLWDGEPDVNIYSGLAKSKIHSKESLIEALINLTNKLLTEINGVTLYEKGLITDTNKIKLELIINARKAKLKQGYTNKSTDEDYRYRKIIKEWFKDEKEFIDELTPLLKSLPEPANVKEQKPLAVNQIALIHVYEGNQITRENAKGIAKKHGYASENSGEGLFQDYTYYSSPANRKSKPSPCTPKKFKNKIQLFESILSNLSDSAKKRAVDEIKILKTLFDNQYD